MEQYKQVIGIFYTPANKTVIEMSARTNSFSDPVSATCGNNARNKCVINGNLVIW